MALLVVNFGSLLVLLALRVIEAPLFGQRRPVTPWITQAVCRVSLLIMGIGYQRHGRAMNGGGVMVANHSSWIDIFALNAGGRLYFVSKAEVARWPGIGWLARATGTVFVDRRRSDARRQIDLFRERLNARHVLMLFPEGTSSDGQRVLPFNPTLFAAFTGSKGDGGVLIQPVSLRYDAPVGADRRFYGWWGDLGFGPHLWQVLSAPRQGQVTVTYHDVLSGGAFADRKALAKAAETTVRSAARSED